MARSRKITLDDLELEVVCPECKGASENAKAPWCDTCYRKGTILSETALGLLALMQNYLEVDSRDRLKFDDDAKRAEEAHRR